ncbi:tyrosine-type recombinase/integrase [Verminephrobacter eiseniae]|nr:tyrosine-type recombinase/integrase [Verminephrobacter eiseniae]
MGDFYWRRSADRRERWWLEIRGKGERTRGIPATDELVSELMRYRKAHELSPLPREGDILPLLVPLIGGARPMGRSGVHELVKNIFRKTAVRLRARGPDHEAAAAHVEQASAHWMRHTAGTHQSDNMDLKVVRDNLGHANIATTSIYIHTEGDKRHDQTSSLHKLGWLAP